jgi:hypothetical protein
MQQDFIAVTLTTMDVRLMLRDLDREIERLRELRSFLARHLEDGTMIGPIKPRPRLRKLSDEGRARIVAAQKLRWAKIKGSGADRTVSADQSPPKAQDV